MSEQKFTPGPWAFDGGKIRGAMMTAKPYNIASVNGHATNEGMANAHMIAAAPDLFKCLECAMHTLDAVKVDLCGNRKNMAETQIRAINEIIARARGEV